MNFDEFWASLQIELKRERKFQTLQQKKKFTAQFNYDAKMDYVHVVPESGIPRGQIRSNEFKGVWNRVKGYSRKIRIKIKINELNSYIRLDGQTGTTPNATYIAALIDDIVKEQRTE